MKKSCRSQVIAQIPVIGSNLLELVSFVNNELDIQNYENVMVKKNEQLGNCNCGNQILMERLKIVPGDELTVIVNCDESKSKYILERLISFFEGTIKLNDDDSFQNADLNNIYNLINLLEKKYPIVLDDPEIDSIVKKIIGETNKKTR